MNAHVAEPIERRTARLIEVAPAEAVGPTERISPIRKPAGFVPAVQRWSFRLPDDQQQMRVAFFGAQAPDAAALARHPLLDWLRAHVEGKASCLDHARFRARAGHMEHVACAYWVDEARFAAWERDEAAEVWWQSSERLVGPLGCWREILRVPRDRQESIYWQDYPAGLMTSPDVEVFPTPYCGYYGAMRDRIPLAATETLDPAPGAVLARQDGRTGFGQHWSVRPPHNLAVIRSANTWGRMDAEQREDYEHKLRVPLERGMEFLSGNPLPSGCACMRWERTTDADGNEAPEEHAHSYFLSLGHMERWAEGHATHAAIFGAAIARYRSYGPRNQLRTWHEVYVLPEGGQIFEYLNCHPDTGLLPWFEAVQLR